MVGVGDELLELEELLELGSELALEALEEEMLEIDDELLSAADELLELDDELLSIADELLELDDKLEELSNELMELEELDVLNDELLELSAELEELLEAGVSVAPPQAASDRVSAATM